MHGRGMGEGIIMAWCMRRGQGCKRLVRVSAVLGGTCEPAGEFRLVAKRVTPPDACGPPVLPAVCSGKE